MNGLKLLKQFKFICHHLTLFVCGLLEDNVTRRPKVK